MASQLVRARPLSVVVFLAALGWAHDCSAQTQPSLFERYLDALRQQAGIPGLSAAIVEDGRIVWERGFGLRDVENTLPALPDTPYPVADLTESFASILIAQCAERGALSLDERMATWTSRIPESAATVRHVLSHASAGAPGSAFKFEPPRYAALTPVIEACGNRPYRRMLAGEVLDRLGMAETVPGRDLATEAAADARALFDPDDLARFAAVLARQAVPYKVDKSGKATRSEVPVSGIDAATGMVSTVRDLARLDAALDAGVLVDAESLAAAWTNTLSSAGAPLPTGLGWFVQAYNGERLVWQFGLTTGAYSSLVMKVPARRLTLILLANSDGLNATPSLAEGDVTASPFARLFLKFFL
jgi:CubicO group peptidase (beta-lactamase class C family)